MAAVAFAVVPALRPSDRTGHADPYVALGPLCLRRAGDCAGIKSAAEFHRERQLGRSCVCGILGPDVLPVIGTSLLPSHHAMPDNDWPHQETDDPRPQ